MYIHECGRFNYESLHLNHINREGISRMSDFTIAEARIRQTALYSVADNLIATQERDLLSVFIILAVQKLRLIS